MNINDTVLARFAKDYSSHMMDGLSGHISSSGFYQLAFMLSTIIALSLLFYSFTKKDLSKYTLVFFIYYILGFPIGPNSRPLIHKLVSGTTYMLASVLQNATHKLFSNGGEAASFPPAMIQKVIIKAGTSQITNPHLREAVMIVIESCIPTGSTDKGSPIGVQDVLAPSPNSELNFNRALLVNRKVVYKSDEISCDQLVGAVKKELHKHIYEKNILKVMTESIFGGKSKDPDGEGIVIGTWNENDDFTGTQFGKHALNLAKVGAINNLVAKEYLGESESALSLNTMNPLNSITAGQSGYTTAIKFWWHSAPDRIGRALNMNGWSETADRLHDINQQMNDLPYLVANIQILLSLATPLVILIGRTIGSLKLAIWWSFTYLGSVIIPWVLVTYRLVANSIILNITRTKEYVGSGGAGGINKALNFNDAGEIFNDSSRWIREIVEFEQGMWKIFLLGITGAGYFVARNHKSQLLASGKGAGDMAGRALGSKAIQKGGDLAKEKIKTGARNFAASPAGQKVKAGSTKIASGVGSVVRTVGNVATGGKLSALSKVATVGAAATQANDALSTNKDSSHVGSENKVGKMGGFSEKIEDPTSRNTSNKDFSTTSKSKGGDGDEK